MPRKSKLEKLLDDLVWPEGIDVRSYYSRLHDDHDGTMEGYLEVGFNPMVGDVWVKAIGAHFGSLRFRDYFGGGQSLRVRNALLILAFAIKLDNESRPQFKDNQLRLPF